MGDIVSNRKYNLYRRGLKNFPVKLVLIWYVLNKLIRLRQSLILLVLKSKSMPMQIIKII